MSYGSLKKRKYLLLIIFSIASLCGPVSIFSDDTDSDTIPIPLYIDEVYTGEISVTILPDESVQLRPSELIAYLEDLMSDEAINTARMIFPETGWLDLTEMSGLGVRILFQFEDLTIHVTIPAHLRRETTISFKGRPQPLAGEYIEKAGFSAFMNLELWNRLSYDTLSYNFSVTPEIGLNIFDWVIEARGSIRTGDLFFWDYSRLVKDFKTLNYRLEVGDLTIPVTDLPGVSKLLGASFRKNYDLISDTDAPSPYSKEIFIREPSRVEIYMNDRKIREKDYKSGNYIFQNFPLTRGVNRISIKWEDSEGQHEENMIIPYEGNLLDAGEMDLGVAAGLPDREFILPAVTSYQYLGITDNFTFGLTESFNIATLNLSIHPDFLVSTKFGNFNLVPVWMINFTGGQKLDTELGYQMTKPGVEDNLNFGATLNYDYDSISNPDLPLSFLSGSGYFNLDFGSGFSFIPKASWGWRFDESRQIINANAVLKKSIKGGSALAAAIGLDYNKELSFSATISYSSSFPELNQNLYILENLQTQTLSTFWNRYAAEEDNLSLNASAELPMKLDDKISLGISAGYQHRLFGISGGHDFNTIIDTGEIHNSTYLSAKSGLVYAEGLFMLTTPVYDSFIIIAPGQEFSDQTLKVNPTYNGSEMQLKGKPGVMAANSFTNRKVYIEPEELPLGMDDAGMKYLAFPSYKSAFVITPQAEIRIFIGGTIKDSEGAPIETTLGRLTGKNNGESVDFFTDENGYFEAYNLSPEVYSLMLAGLEETAFIDLTAVDSGFHDAGLITIQEH